MCAICDQTMNEPAEKLATYPDIIDLPDSLVGEIIGSQLVTHPRPAPTHALAASAIGSLVFAHYDRTSTEGPGGWWILNEPECHLGADVVVPDIAGWRRSTMAQLPDMAWFEIPPDWVSEIISPSSHRYDRTGTRDLYARHGVSHYWIVDPAERLIEVFELVERQWLLVTTVRDEMGVTLVPFDEMPFELGRLWA